MIIYKNLSKFYLFFFLILTYKEYNNFIVMEYFFFLQIFIYKNGILTLEKIHILRDIHSKVFNFALLNFLLPSKLQSNTVIVYEVRFVLLDAKVSFFQIKL